MTKFLIIGDLHGAEPEFYYDDFDAIIAPGDFCSSELREYEFEAVRKTEETGEEVSWWDLVGEEEAKELVEQSLEAGREVLERLDEEGVPIYVVPGNWDWTPQENCEWEFLRKNHFEDTLIKGLDNVINIDNWIYDTGDHHVIGYGKNSGPEHPQSKEELERYTLEELDIIKEDFNDQFDKLAALFEQATKPVIFLTHNVPYDTPLDVIDMEDSPRNGEHCGSVIARDLVEEYQPLVCVGAHIHEHFGKCEMGNTTVINAGFGPDKNTFLELEGNEIKKLEFHQLE